MALVEVVQMPGHKHRGITPGRRHAYESMRAKGMSKGKAARIANAGKTRAGRSAMARKGGRRR